MGFMGGCIGFTIELERFYSEDGLYLTLRESSYQIESFSKSFFEIFFAPLEIDKKTVERLDLSLLIPEITLVLHSSSLEVHIN